MKLDPEVVLVVLLPPLLHGSSIFANFSDFRADRRALTLSAVGLVLAPMGAVAWAAHALIGGLPWAAAFALGAIVAPDRPARGGDHHAAPRRAEAPGQQPRGRGPLQRRDRPLQRGHEPDLRELDLEESRLEL